MKRLLLRLLLRAFILILIVASFPALAFAEDVYNFQFQKKAPAAPLPLVDAPVEKDRTKEISPAPSVQNPVLQALMDERSWAFGLGAAAKVQTASFDFRNGWNLYGGYQFSKFLGLETQVLFGKGTVFDHDFHLVAAGGARITPIHIRFFDTDLIDLSALVGLLTGMSESDTSKARVTIYVGYEVAVNIGTHFAVLLNQKLEEGDTRLYQLTYSLVYRF